MDVLFVHQNYPAQFRHVAPALAARGWRCTFVTNNVKTPAQDGVRKVLYRPIAGLPVGSGGSNGSEITRSFLNETAHAHGVYEALKGEPDVCPDLGREKGRQRKGEESI